MILKIDLHVHTNRSPDGRSSLDDILKSAAEIGLDAVAVADHDLLSQPCDSKDVIIIPACECSTSEGHIVGLFISSLPSCLRSQSGRLPSAEETIGEIHSLGGYAIWAHPYERISSVNESSAALADAIEVYNSRACFKNPDANKMALELANRLGKPMTAGSDAHHSSEVGNSYTELDCPEKSLDCIHKTLTENMSSPVFVRNTPRIKKGLSQLAKCRRSGATPLRYLKAFAYILYCLILDIIRR
ncbi:MAG: histidinol-phosphatase [Clostridia bacterium]|nr:histidinol-phosphatase [Clostridia bacterium]MBQ5813967.1 histidinol-phosphatase [Clostridia bacterium]